MGLIDERDTLTDDEKADSVWDAIAGAFIFAFFFALAVMA